MSGETATQQEQMARLVSVYRVICERTSVHPHSSAGRELAQRLLERFTGNEGEIEILQHFTH